MEGTLEVTPSVERTELYRGGAGGKMKKPLSRNSRATPYSRPKPARSQAAGSCGREEEGADGGGRWWLARLVEPAFRLISGGATRILPSLFAKPTDDDEDDLDGIPTETEQDIEAGGDKEASGERPATDVENSSSLPVAKTSPEHTYDKNKGTGNDLGHDDGLLQIEQMIKGKMFSRDEICHLTEILQSRTAELPTAEEGQVKPATVAGEDAGNPSVGPEVVQEVNKKCQIPNEAQWEVSTPLLNSNVSLVQDQIGASPIDIAKAYMGRCVSDIGTRSNAGKSDRAMIPGNGYISQTVHPSTLPKPSVCWPGAMVTDQYVTPQNQSSRYGVHSFSRSPYARSLRSLPKSKVTSRNLLGNGHESIGPIRRAKQEFATGSPRRFLNATIAAEPSSGGKIGLGRTSTPVFKNVEAGETSGTSKPQSLDGKSLGVPTVPTQSSQVAMKILEHLDRTFPSPKDKAAELKLASSWRKPKSPHSTQGSTIASENGLENSLFKVPPQKNAPNALVIQGQASAPDEVTHNAVPSQGARLSIPPKAGNVSNSSQSKSNEGTSIIPPSAVDSMVKDVPIKPPFLSKAALPSISVQKSKCPFSSDNGTGFTFPISASPAVFPEPPTPSVIPASSSNSLHPPQDMASIPAFNFGLKRSSPALVFSFPSTSNSTINIDSSDLKFSFGSDKKRISFSSIGKDAICC